MKVLAFNGSPRREGNTSHLIKAVFAELTAAGIETEEINVGLHQMRGCMACGKCGELLNGHCSIKNDQLNELLDKMKCAAGIILGSPVYCADVSGQMKCFMDRATMVASSNNNMLARKVGASVVAVRRAGALPAFHTMNSWFTIQQMIVVGSSYWNMGYGLEPGEVMRDEEGLQTMRNLGRNMAWLLKVMEIGRQTVAEPDTPKVIRTNFIR